jgi:uncharacterized protein (DUF433 family)
VLLEVPAYRPAEAARLAGTTPTTVARWFKGYRAPGHRMAPVLPRPNDGSLSWLQLVEVAFIADFRRLGMRLERLRQAHDHVRATFGVAYPFAQLRFRTDGVHLLVPYGDQLVAADAGGQLSWAGMIQRRLEQLDYADDVVVRWHPRGRDCPVVLDPRVAFGAPHLVGTGVPTWAARERHRGGDPPATIAEDLGLTAEQVAAALAFESVVPAP